MKALLRAGAVLAGTTTALALAGPAFADTTADLGIKLAGTTITAGSDGKFTSLSLSNAGPSAAVNPLIKIDISDLTESMVTFVPGGCGEPEDGIVYCGIEDELLEAGPDVDWFFPLVKVEGGGTGNAGTITATIEHDGTDPNPANNSVTADVVLSDEPGVDLLVWAPDVYEWDDEAEFFTEEPITPGGTSRVYVEVLNQGDATADGFKVQLKLPEYATLAEPEPDCVFAADLRSATCEYKQLWLDPFLVSGTFHKFYWKIDISEDATGPALTGGVVTIDALGVKEIEQPTVLKGATADLPEQFQDADVTDNTDEYSVFVDEGGEGGGGPLPVTGPAATAMAAGGGAIVLLGAVLLVVSRRRRVITQA